MTTRQARRAYQKSKKTWKPSSQFMRQAARREELEKRARKIEAKERRAKETRRKREAKEAEAKETLRKAIEQKRLPPEAALGKVGSSQPRLNSFFGAARAAAATSETEAVTEAVQSKDLALQTEVLTQECSYNGSSPSKEPPNEVKEGEDLGIQVAPTTINDSPVHQPRSANISDAHDEFGDLANFISSQNPLLELTQVLCKEKGTTQSRTLAPLTEGKATCASNAKIEVSRSANSSKLTALGLQCPSPPDWDFAIVGDAEIRAELCSEILVSADRSLRQTLSPISAEAKPSRNPLSRKRKAPAADITFLTASPVKSARHTLSELSPSDVNNRAQRKPDGLPAYSPGVVAPSLWPQQGALKQPFADELGWLSTQFLEDDEFGYDKENQSPWQSSTKSAARRWNRSKGKESDLRSPSYFKKSPHVKGKAVQISSIDSIRGRTMTAFQDSQIEGGEIELDGFDDELDEEALYLIARLSDEQSLVSGFAPTAATISANESQRKLGTPLLSPENGHAPAPQKNVGKSLDVNAACSLEGGVRLQGAPQCNPPPSKLLAPSQDYLDGDRSSGDHDSERTFILSKAVAKKSSTKQSTPGHLAPTTLTKSFGSGGLLDDDLAGFAAQFEGGSSAPPVSSAPKPRSDVIPWNHPSQFSGFTTFDQASSAGALSIVENDVELDSKTEMQDPKTAFEDAEADYRAHMMGTVVNVGIAVVSQVDARVNGPVDVLDSGRRARAHGGGNLSGSANVDRGATGDRHAEETNTTTAASVPSFIATGGVDNTCIDGTNAGVEEMNGKAASAHSTKTSVHTIAHSGILSTQLSWEARDSAEELAGFLSQFNDEDGHIVAKNSDAEGLQQGIASVLAAPSQEPRRRSWVHNTGQDLLSPQVAKSMLEELLVSLAEDDEFL